MRIFRSLLISLRSFDWILFGVVTALSIFGITAIYSVDLSGGGTLHLVTTQAIAFVIAIFVCFVGTNIHIRVYQSAARFIYIFVLFLLLAVLFFGTTISGMKGWFHVGGISFQPAEFAKVSLVLVLAWLIDRYGRRFRSWQFFVATGLATLFVIGLIMLQPDLGSAFIMAGLWFGLLLVTKIKKRYIVLLFGVCIGIFLLGWFVLFAQYQRNRILIFLYPSNDPLGAGYNVTQSIIAIGSGGLFGQGLGFGTQSQLHFLPAAQTDFIFSVIGEELGFVGIVLLLSLYVVLYWRLFAIARRCRDDFSAYLVVGVALVLFVQMSTNIGGATGLLPVTGVPLPFVSYGGSSLLISFVLISLVESVVLNEGKMGAHYY